MEKYSKSEIEESNKMYDEFMKSFKSHKCDWSEVLKPIADQLKTMKFTEVTDILREEYCNKIANCHINFTPFLTSNNKS